MVKCNSFKKLYGVALLDEWRNPLVYESEGTDELTEKFETVWRGIVNRTLSKTFKRDHPTYRNVTICDEWLLFSNFANWAFAEYKEGLTIDKDILAVSNKIYSPETCCFVPHYINVAAVSRPKAGKLSLGVYKYTKRGKLVYKQNCTDFKSGGIYRKEYYNTQQEAHRAWQEGKIKYLNDMLNYYAKQKYYRQDVAEVFYDFIDSILLDIKLNKETTHTFFTLEQLSARGPKNKP